MGELGFTFTDEEFEDIYQAFLEVADKKKEVYDEDLESIVHERERVSTAVWNLDAVQVSCGFPLTPTATITLTNMGGETFTACAYGTGPIDAAYKAVDQIVAVANDLAEFSGEGRDARHRRARRGDGARDGRERRGVHRPRLDGDIIVSSTKAYLNALNRLISDQGEEPSFGRCPAGRRRSPAYHPCSDSAA